MRILIVMLFCLLSHPAFAARPGLAAVPSSIASNHFIVTIDDQATPVFHAALNLYFLNFEAAKHSRITVTADTDGFWDRGVEVQPWRLNIRPARQGRTISFTMDGPAKISISRPGDFLGNAEMLYLFSNQSERNAPRAAGPGLRYFGPGVHTENIDALDGESIYLAPGAVVFGSLNVWGVSHVKVFGRGVIVYDGPQNPADDDGWMHQRNWHCIVMDKAHDISIEGITCVVRSRTWQIQMKDSRQLIFDNIKVIGANDGNANADGMDWLGGGDTIVRNSFFRAADDIFALQTSWEGYGPKAFAVQGSPVTNILIEGNTLSTSISNIVRVGWPEKNFEGGNFVMRDTDVMHMGLGGCGVPFALMELWAEPAGRGQSAGFHFDDIRLEDWYSLTQLRQDSPGMRDVSFTDIAALEHPALLPSVLSGNVADVRFDNVTAAGVAGTSEEDLPLDRQHGAPTARFASTASGFRIVTSTGLIRPGQPVAFEAVGLGTLPPGLRYTWLFGDGTTAQGPKVKHRFPDTAGTLRDGSGRFRVLLHITGPGSRHSWAYAPIVVRDALLPALTHSWDGVHYVYSELDQGELGAVAIEGTAPSFQVPAPPHPEDYGLSMDGGIEAPDDGTYSFLLVANDQAQLMVDGQTVATAPKPFAQVCGLKGNAARALPVDLALAKGPHRIHMVEVHGAGRDDFKLLWRTPGGTIGPIDLQYVSRRQ